MGQKRKPVKDLKRGDVIFVKGRQQTVRETYAFDWGGRPYQKVKTTVETFSLQHNYDSGDAVTVALMQDGDHE